MIAREEERTAHEHTGRFARAAEAFEAARRPMGRRAWSWAGFERTLAWPAPGEEVRLGLGEASLLAGCSADAWRAVEPPPGHGADAWILAAAACDPLGLAAERRAAG